jgi:pyruvate,orthophosphate dikinase
VIGTGLPASPGAATGEIVFTADAAVEAEEGRKVILVRVETSPRIFTACMPPKAF